MFNVSGEHLESGSPLCAALDLKGLFVLNEKIDGARRGRFPGSSRLKQNSQHRGGRVQTTCRVVTTERAGSVVL